MPLLMLTSYLLSSLIACGIYYWLWAFIIPKYRGYQLRQELVDLGGGVQSNKLRKIPVSELEEWDATHDKAGSRIEALAEEIQVQTKSSETSLDKLETKKGPNTNFDASV